MASQAPVHPCRSCGLIQEVPALEHRQKALCARCGMVVDDPFRSQSGNRLCSAAAISALILYLPAVTLPILTVERLGYSRPSSVWEGVVRFLSHGDWFVGSVVLICSVIIPVLKLLGLLFLVHGKGWIRPATQSRLFRWIEWTGRWGMLDVLLIAFLVAWVKMGDLVAIRPGKAVILFCTMVVLSLVASAFFDPEGIWREENENQRT
ncbi:MAG: paraquat-inducible protein A [Planctomycetota bacterium]|nr:paraquat-inducible protein A [Planctomycetota bacterium]